MEQKQIDLSRSVYDLCNEFPELTKVLEQIGFKDITKPGMLSTAGRFMTIPKGAALKKIDPSLIRQTLAEQGFHVSNL
jgi:formate-dependent phosphoribosylglycinamide formyltransferase (GAR transformylase)